MVILKNNTQAVSKIGYCVQLDPRDPNAFIYATANAVKVVGVVMESVDYRKPCKIATIGDTAKVYVPGNVVKGDILRTVKTGDRISLGAGVIVKAGDAPYLRIGEALTSGRGFIDCVLDLSYVGSNASSVVYACIAYDAEPIHTADSYSEVSGATITSGTVVDTRTINTTYLTVQEDQKFDIQFTFSGLEGHPARCTFVGRYQGNPAHAVWLYIWNYSGVPAWDRVTADATDFPSSATDYQIDFLLPNADDYISGGEAKLRIYHNSVAVNTHYMYIDYLDITHDTLDMPVIGTGYQLTGFTEDAMTDNIVVDASAGTITIPVTGDYLHTVSSSFTGLPDTIITCSLLVNAVKVTTLWKRQLNATGDVGSASSSAIRTFQAGDVITYTCSSNIASSYLSMIAMRCSVVRLDNIG